MIATGCGGRWDKWKAETISMRDHPCIAIGQSMSESEAANGQSLSVHLLAGQLEPPKRWVWTHDLLSEKATTLMSL